MKPNWFERAFGKVLVWLIRAGIVRGHFFVLEVRGRKSGRVFALPVDPIEVGGMRYLVCPRGEAAWVRNARAAGEVALVQGGTRRRYGVEEVEVAARAGVLQAYLAAYAGEVQRFFEVRKGADLAEFATAAGRYPVFLLTARADA